MKAYDRNWLAWLCKSIAELNYTNLPAQVASCYKVEIPRAEKQKTNSQRMNTTEVAVSTANWCRLVGNWLNLVASRSIELRRWSSDK